MQSTVANRTAGGFGRGGRTLLAMAGVSVLALAACSRAKTAAGFARPPASVTVAEAVTQDVPVYLDEVGKCVAREVVSVEPQVSGRLTAILFADGSDVHAGDPLFTIDARPYQAQLDVAKATLAQAKAALDLAKTEFARAAQLYRTKAIAEQEYETRRNAVEVAEAQVSQGEAAVANARLNVEYCSIRSPIEGRTGHRLVDVGNIVTANSGSLLMIQRLDPIYADFTVTQNDLTAVQREMARGALKVEIRLPDETGQPASGELTFLDNAVQDATGTVTLRATVPNHEYHFWPGRFVKVRLVLDTLRGAVLVPAAAPQVSGQGPFVYVVTADSTAQLRPVTPGQRQGSLVVISKGLTAGERVIVNGQLAVTPGGKVQVKQAPNAVANVSASPSGSTS